MSRNLLQAFLRVGVSLGALAVVIYLMRDKLRESLDILKTGVSWEWFFLAAVGYLLVQVIMAYRLFHFFRVQRIMLSYGQTLYLAILGLFFNLFLPSALGGDVAKIYYAYKHSGKKIESATAILVDRLMGLFAISLIAILAIGWLHLQGKLPNPRILVGAVFFLCVIGGMTVFFGDDRIGAFLSRFSFLLPSVKIRQKISEVYGAVHGYKSHMGTLGIGLLLSVAGQGVLIFLYYWLARSLRLDVPPVAFFALVPLICTASMAPSLGGLGVREAGAVYFLSLYMPSEMALAHSLLMNILLYGFGALSGVLFALRGGLGAASSMPDLENSVDSVEGN